MTNAKKKNKEISVRKIMFYPVLSDMFGSPNRAIIFQQVLYFLKKSDHKQEGRLWIYNSVKKWKNNHLPSMSETTIKESFNYFKKLGIISVDRFNAKKYDRTNWFTIHEEKFIEFKNEYLNSISDPEEKRLAINDLKDITFENIVLTTLDGNRPMEKSETDQPIPENTTEKTKTYKHYAEQEKKPSQISKKEKTFITSTNKKIIFKTINYLNQKTNSNHKASTVKTRININNILNAGYNFDNLIELIDKQILIDQENNFNQKYLTPEILFNFKNFKKFFEINANKIRFTQDLKSNKKIIKNTSVQYSQNTPENQLSDEAIKKIRARIELNFA